MTKAELIKQNEALKRFAKPYILDLIADKVCRKYEGPNKWPSPYTSPPDGWREAYKAAWETVTRLRDKYEKKLIKEYIKRGLL